MPRSGPWAPEARPLLAAAAVIAALTAWRLALLPLATAELFVDETQYWAWGQDLAWGYYSKPPLIGWVIRAATEIGGADTAFWIRMPGALFHAATAILVAGAAREVTDATGAALAGVAYLTLPLAAVGSFLISTDTILLPFFAAALWLWLRLMRAPSRAAAVGLGLCLGLGFLAKYAAIYFPLGAAVAWALVPGARIAPRDAGLALAVFAAVIAPNLVWNLANDLVTFSHTADNADWVGEALSLHPDRAAEFLGAQFAVMGPVLFAAFLWAGWRTLRAGDARTRLLLALSAPILLVVTGQALLSRAYANWAVTAFVAGTILTVALLRAHAPRVLAAGIALNALVALALPVAGVAADGFVLPGRERPVFHRYLGREEASARILAEADAADLATVVSGHRDLLADLVHAARDREVAIRAVPVDGPPPHFYAQTMALPPDRAGAVLFAGFGPPPDCGGERLAAWTAGPAYRGAEIEAWRVPADCWAAP